MMYLVFLCVFSSRRRHTRCYRDWSSDVCSSDLTQQVVKNVYAGTYETDPETGQQVYTVPPRTFGQKIRESLLAMKVEQEFTKDEILATYLNTVYFGRGAYGVQAAAQTYWSKDVGELTLLECATLAGIIPSPSLFDPVQYQDQG